METEVEHIRLCEKTSFRDEKYATEYLKKLKATSIRQKRPVRAYLCDICLNWHLTSLNEHQTDVLHNYKKELKNKNEIIANQQRLIKVLKREIHDLKFTKKK